MEPRNRCKENSLSIIQCADPRHWEEAKRLTRAYTEWLAIDLSFQNFEREMDRFELEYGPPDGCYLLARVGENPAGGVGLRKLDGSTCEMKRLYVPDAFKGKGIGLGLCKEFVEKARSMGYKTIRLDTLDRLVSANLLYEKIGFYDIPAYYDNPEPGARYMEYRIPDRTKERTANS